MKAVFSSSSLVFTCGRRPTGHGAIPVVVVVGVVIVVVVIVGCGKRGGGSHPILKS